MFDYFKKKLLCEKNKKWLPYCWSHIFKCNFAIECCCILIKISLDSAPKILTDSRSILVQVKAWNQLGNKPLPELVKILYCIYVSSGLNVPNFPNGWSWSFASVEEHEVASVTTEIIMRPS